MTRQITCLLFESLATVVVVISSSHWSWSSCCCSLITAIKGWVEASGSFFLPVSKLGLPEADCKGKRQPAAFLTTLERHLPLWNGQIWPNTCHASSGSVQLTVMLWVQGMPGVGGVQGPLRRHGDEVERLPGGFFVAHGRCDDTMNLGGIKVRIALPRCYRPTCRLMVNQPFGFTSLQAGRCYSCVKPGTK